MPLDLFLDAMPFVAILLDSRPMVRDGLLAAIHVDVVEFGIAQFALVEGRQHPCPIRVKVLVGAGTWVNADNLPRFGEALIFLRRPFDAGLRWCPGSLPFLPARSLGRRRRRHLDVFVNLLLAVLRPVRFPGLLILFGFFVNLPPAVGYHFLHNIATRHFGEHVRSTGVLGR